MANFNRSMDFSGLNIHLMSGEPHQWTIDVEVSPMRDSLGRHTKQLVNYLKTNHGLRDMADLDVIFIDSLHEPNHIRNVFYNYFKFLKKDGLIFIDDISWLPYIEGGIRDNNFIERINRLTFNKVLEIFNANQKSLSLEINFSGTGLAIFKKNDNKLNDEYKIKNRLLTLKNLIKNIYAPKPKK